MRVPAWRRINQQPALMIQQQMGDEAEIDKSGGNPFKVRSLIPSAPHKPPLAPHTMH